MGYQASTKQGVGAFAVFPHALRIRSWPRSFCDYDGKLLLYFTTLLSYRGALEKITYALAKENPDTDFAFPAWDQPGIALITNEVLPYFLIPKETRWVTIQLTYKNGEKSEMVRIER